MSLRRKEPRLLRVVIVMAIAFASALVYAQCYCGTQIGEDPEQCDCDEVFCDEFCFGCRTSDDPNGPIVHGMKGTRQYTDAILTYYDPYPCGEQFAIWEDVQVVCSITDFCEADYGPGKCNQDGTCHTHSVDHCEEYSSVPGTPHYKWDTQTCWP